MRKSIDTMSAVDLTSEGSLFGFMPGSPRFLARANGANVKLLFGYAGAGSIGTAAHFAVLYAALHAIGPVAASTLGAVVGCIVNFFLSQNFVFRGRQSAQDAFPRFVAVAALGVLLNAVVIQALITSFPIFLGQLIATATVFLFTFAFNNVWTFSERRI